MGDVLSSHKESMLASSCIHSLQLKVLLLGGAHPCTFWPTCATLTQTTTLNVKLVLSNVICKPTNLLIWKHVNVLSYQQKVHSYFVFPSRSMSLYYSGKLGGRVLKLGWSPERLSNLPDMFLYSSKKDESSLQTATNDECDTKSEKMRHLQLCRWVTTLRWFNSVQCRVLFSLFGCLKPVSSMFALTAWLCIYTVKQITV